MSPPSRTSKTIGRSNLWRIESHVFKPLAYRERRRISSSLALENTAWRATSSTNDQFRVDAGWRHPKDLHVSARLRSSRDVPRNEDIWVTILGSRRDRSTVVVTTRTTGSTEWSHRPRSFSFSDSSSAILRCSSSFLRRSSAFVVPPSLDVFGLFTPPYSAILDENGLCLGCWTLWPSVPSVSCVLVSSVPALPAKPPKRKSAESPHKTKTTDDLSP